jgi:formate/nitrite transporter FocA (FNT family)
MGAPEPEEIFERTRKEGERRLSRPLLELASTAVAAGIDVVFGIIALGTISALFTKRFGPDTAHFFGSLGFGLAFVFIVVGRSELFTENFLVPLAGIDRGDRGSWWKLLELWTLSPVLNILGGALLIVIVTTHGVLPDHTGHPLVDIANKLDANNFLAAFMSAIAAGALITLMTWMVEGQESMGVRVAVAWMVGVLLTLGAFNHVIVVTLELLMGIRYGASVGWDSFFANFGTALLGNMIGGIGLVTLTRFMQAQSGGRGGSSSSD